MHVSWNQGRISGTHDFQLLREQTLCSLAVGITISTGFSEGAVQLKFIINHCNYISFCEDSGYLSNISIGNHSCCQEASS